MYNIGLKMT